MMDVMYQFELESEMKEVLKKEHLINTYNRNYVTLIAKRKATYILILLQTYSMK